MWKKIKPYLPLIIIVTLILVVVALALILISGNNSAREIVSDQNLNDRPIEESIDEAESLTPEIDLQEVPGVYKIYNGNAAELTNSTTKRTVLFFSAYWCPTCQAFERDVAKNKQSLPTDVTIIEIEYQQYSALEKKYGINTQHTFVEIDNQGNLLKKWLGGNDINSFERNLT